MMGAALGLLLLPSARAFVLLGRAQGPAGLWSSSSTQAYERFLKQEEARRERRDSREPRPVLQGRRKDKSQTLAYPSSGRMPAERSIPASASASAAPSMRDREPSMRDREAAYRAEKKGAPKKPAGKSAGRAPKRDSLEALSFSRTATIDPSLTTSLADSALSPATVAALAAKGFTHLTPVQSQAYEAILAGGDVVARSKTGSGKTLAFGLPLVERLLVARARDNGAPRPSVLVLEPTRELALQVTGELAHVCRAHGLRVAAVYGGVPLSFQERALAAGVDIVVATPGRALDLVTRGSLRLDAVSSVVLDEGDTMLEMGFQRHVETLLLNVREPGSRAREAARRSLDEEDADGQAVRAEGRQRDVQTLLFSATMAGWICNIVQRHMSQPLFLDALVKGEARLPESIAHVALSYPAGGKSRLKAVAACVFEAVVTFSQGGKTIVFTDTKAEADHLLEAAPLACFRPKVLHGGLSQGARQATIKLFREGAVDLLIATDVAARGLDVLGVDLVVHSQPPDDLDAYVHRSGRTGRAGRAGVAVTLHSLQPKEVDKLRAFEQGLKIRFERVAPVATSALPELARAYSVRKGERAASALSEVAGKRAGKSAPPEAGDGAAKPQSKAAARTASGALVIAANEEGELLGNWALPDNTPNIEENLLLRDALRLETETGVRTLSEEQRARATMLTERSARKREKRAHFNARLAEQKKAAAVGSVDA